MSQDQLIILGSSSQIPTRHRNHNGYLLRLNGKGLLFDPGEGTQRQFILANVSPICVTHIFITHFHGDHCLGLPGMIQRLSLAAPERVIHVYYPAKNETYMERLRYASLYHDQLETEYHPVNEDGVVHETDDFIVEAKALDHSVVTYGYQIREPDSRRFIQEKLTALGLEGPIVGKLKREGSIVWQKKKIRIEEVTEMRRGRIFAFVMDTKPCSGALALAKGADLLVCESTYLEHHAHFANKYSHMTAKQAGQLAKDAGASRLILTHFSPRYKDLSQFPKQAQEVFESVEMAHDMARFRFPRLPK